MVFQNSSSNPYIVVQWCSDTISEMTALVISLIVSLHQCTTIQGFDDEFVGKQDIGPHEVS